MLSDCMKTRQPKKQTNDFHWTPSEQDLLRQFLAKCIMEFGGKKASRVMDELVRQWIDGRVKVRLED
jgi:hypothetical protein